MCVIGKELYVYWLIVVVGVCLGVGYVNFIDVGVLFVIDFDVDEVGVE